MQSLDRLRFLVLALNGEAGELANLIKKEWRGDLLNGQDDYRSAVISELADVGNYTFMIAKELGVDLLDEMQLKFDLVEQTPKWKLAHGEGRTT